MPTASLPSLQTPETHLERHFGLSQFREGQREVIDSLLAGRSTLAVMPTGRGKSLCYQLPALLLPGVTLVVSPLIALMKDQVDALTAKGIAATFINSSLEASEQQRRIAAMREGAYKLVYVAPERFRHRGFVSALADVEVSLFAVDEAHCLSQWGHDFRPDYLKLKAAVAACGHPTVLAATATATPEVRDDIIAQLQLKDPRIVVSGFDRPNLRYVVRYASGDEAKLAKLDEVLGKIAGTAIVYAATRKNVEAIADHLRAQGIPAVAYHAGLEDHSRAWAQNQFMAGEARVVVATNAFGMGIDKPDVRVVVHYDLPGTLEAYYQEAGRAGRDGHTSFCVLLFSPADRYLQEFFIEGGSPKPITVATIYRLLAEQEEAEIFMSHEAINRQLPTKTHDMAVGTALVLLERAGLIERLAKGTAKAHLKLLLPDAQVPRSPVQQRVLEAVKGLPGVLAGGPLDVASLAALLQESREATHHALVALRQKGIVEYTPPARTQGIRVVKRVADPLAELDVAHLESKQQREMAKLDRMVGFAYARRCRRNTILDYFGERTVSDCGRCDVCRHQVDPALDVSAEKPAPAADEPAHLPLYDTLRGLRSQEARAHDVPPYMIFTDAALKEMATYLPTTHEDFLAIKGVGRERLAKYGDVFLEAIRGFSDQHGLAPAGAPKPGSRKPPTAEKKARTQAQVAALYREGLAVEAIAERCLRSPQVVEDHLLELAEAGEIDLEHAIRPHVRREIEAAIDRLGGDRLRPLKEALPESISYFEIRAVLHLQSMAF